MISDLKIFDLMERMGPRWEVNSSPNVRAVHSSR